MKNILISLLSGLSILSFTNSIIINREDNNKSQETKINSCYIRLEDVIIDMLSDKIVINYNNLNSEYNKIITYFDAAIWNKPCDQIDTSLHVISQKWVNGLSKIYTISPTDKLYLRGYLSYVYEFVPTYTMMPFVHADLLKRFKNLPQIELNRLRQILTLMKNNDSVFGSANNPLHGVDNFFVNNLNVQKGYNPILNSIAKINPFENLQPKAQYAAGDWTGYYKFYLFYDEIPNHRYIAYEGDPFTKGNWVYFK